jgi:hypothetical protein
MASFEMSDLEKDIAALVELAAPPGKHSARSAIRHVQRAWLLREADAEIALFRAITAEEESASAIFWAFRRRKYRRADELDPRDHVQKNAVTPFAWAVREVLSGFNEETFQPQLIVDRTGKEPKLLVQCRVVHPQLGLTFAKPDRPLNFNLEVAGQAYDFVAELDRFAKSRKFSTVLKMLQDRANQRNRILYASGQGIPNFAGDLDRALQQRREHTFRNLAFFLLVDQYPGEQLFARQLLDGFLKVVKRLPSRGTCAI